MKVFSAAFLLFLATSIAALSSPLISFEQLMMQSEENPAMILSARTEAIRQNIPVGILTTDKVIAEVKSLENGQPVYAVIINPLDIYSGGYTAFYYELRSRLDLSKARLDYGNKHIVDNTGGFFDVQLSDNGTVPKLLMVTDFTFDRVYMFNSANGDLVDTAYIPRTSPQLQSPKHALQHFNGVDILVADQISDVVQRFAENGKYTNVFAPAGGVNTAILDNIRGAAYKPDNNLLVTVGSGANQNTVQEFDNSGNHVGTFLPTTNLNSPFAIAYRASDLLVSNFSGTNRISRYDHSGNFLSYFYVGSLIAGPQQIYELPNNDVLVAAFSTPSGLAYFRGDGTFVKMLNVITGNRAAYLLGNGRYLTANGGGVHEIDSASGALIRTIVTGANYQYISELELNQPQLRVNMRHQAFAGLDTLTVELRNGTSPYSLVESKKVIGGNAVPSVVRFNTALNATNYYIVVKHRNSIETWSAVTRTFTGNYSRFDFTTSPFQAYGLNMVDLGGVMAFWTGDANQDGIVDGADGSLIDNDAFSFLSGYVSTDLNYDNIVDGTDASFCDNNAFNYIATIRPN